jgi:hypothetical protein
MDATAREKRTPLDITQTPTTTRDKERLRQREQKKHVGHTTEGKRGEQQEGTYLLEHSSKLMSG